MDLIVCALFAVVVLVATILFGIAGALLAGILPSALDVDAILEVVIAVLVAALLIALLTGADRRRAATG
jgi:hypothetical protein